MDLRQLRYFVAIVEHGSFSRAAVALQVAQPALSLHVRNMENDFGTALLVRTAQGVKSTEAGEILYRNACSIIKHFEETRATIQQRNGNPEGEVSIAVSFMAPLTLTNWLVAEARSKLPHIRLSFDEGGERFLVNSLHEGQTELGFLFEPIYREGLVLSKISAEELVLVASPTMVDGTPLSEAQEISFAELADLPLIMPNSGSALRPMLETRAKAAGLNLRSVVDTGSVSCAVSMIDTRHGYAVLPRSVIQSKVDQGRYRVWSITSPELVSDLYVAHSSQRPLSRSASLLVQLCSTFGQHSGHQGGSFH